MIHEFQFDMVIYGGEEKQKAVWSVVIGFERGK
jgi:hypothetical protein